MTSPARATTALEWISYLLSAQTGTVVTPAQLLGTTDEEAAAKKAANERSLEVLEKKRREAGLLS